MQGRPATAARRLYRCAALVLLFAMLAMPAVARADSIFAITGRGYGHGIGMTQYGAEGYARQGKTYDWILAHYFQGTDLATRPELTVKVDLDRDKLARTSWRIAATSSAATLTITDIRNGAHSVEVTRGVSVWITFSAGGAQLRSDKVSSTGVHSAGSVVATFPAACTASTGPAATSMVSILTASGPYAATGIGWRGVIRFDPHTTTGHAIDYVPMEQYVRGVVPRESPSSWPAEALRAQAVAARSYAYGSALAGSVLWCTTMSQVYDGAMHGSSRHETDATDSAVSATAQQVVVYGTKVVQTFFSSSSGGHTANIEDVWYGSSPQPYYVGVSDADSVSDNPNYRWSLANMSGTTMAGKVRAKYSSLAQPSPATITTLTLDVAPSGFVRHITLFWSKGASTTLSGTQFQSVLGMKTSAYKVVLTNPPPTVFRYEDTGPLPLWTGTWSAVFAASASGGRYHSSNAAGATWTVMFKGTSFAWIATRTNHGGRADVSLDGAHMATVDLYSSTTKYRTTAWSRSGLAPDTTHTVVVRVLGTHSSASAGSYVYVDASDVAGSLLLVPRPPSWKRYDQSSSKATYQGTWLRSSSSSFYGGTRAYSHQAGATVKFVFAGSQVRWIGRRAPNFGKAWVSIDASAPVLVDLYSAYTRSQLRLFQSALLPVGTHTMTIRLSGTKNPKSTYHYVDVDAFEALEP